MVGKLPNVFFRLPVRVPFFNDFLRGGPGIANETAAGIVGGTSTNPFDAIMGGFALCAPGKAGGGGAAAGTSFGAFVTGVVLGEPGKAGGGGTAAGTSFDTFVAVVGLCMPGGAGGGGIKMPALALLFKVPLMSPKGGGGIRESTLLDFDGLIFAGTLGLGTPGKAGGGGAAA